MSIEVNYEPPSSGTTGKITIKENNREVANIETNTFYNLNNIQLNDNDTTFIRDQTSLRILDCVKDGKIKKKGSDEDTTTLRVDDVIDICYNNGNKRTPFPKGTLKFSDLEALERSFLTRFQNKIIRKAWTKVSNDSELDPKLETQFVFKEAGLDAKYFIDTPHFVGNFANEVIDPARRSALVYGRDEVFPAAGVPISFTGSFMELFGFWNCELRGLQRINGITMYGGKKTPVYKSKRTTFKNMVIDPQGTTKGTTKGTRTKGRPTKGTTRATVRNVTLITKAANKPPVNMYNFQIVFPGLQDPIVSRLTTYAPKLVVDWFQGNAEKNMFIKTYTFPKTAPVKAIKNGLIMAKEMGDVMQILMMLIWHHSTRNNKYTMATGDNVVLLLCIALNLNCIVTSQEREDLGSGLKKVRCIRIFQSNLNPLENAISEFTQTKAAIVNENNRFLWAIQYLKNNRFEFYDKQYSRFQPNDRFYDSVFADITQINDILQQMSVSKTDPVNDIELHTQNIRKNFLILPFIYYKKDKYVFHHPYISYTTSNEMWKQQYTPVLPNYLRYKFVTIASNMRKTTGGGGKHRLSHIREDKEEEEEEEEEEDQNQKEDVESFLSFAREPAFYYDKDLNQTVDLYVHLHANIKQQMDALKIDDVYFDSIVRSLYHHFYIRREVIYDKELLILIQHIVKHEYANKMDITPGEFIELTKELKKQSLTAKEMTSLTPSSSSYSSLTPVPLVQQTKKNYSPMNDVFNKMNTSRIPISQIGAHRFNSK